MWIVAVWVVAVAVPWAAVAAAVAVPWAAAAVVAARLVDLRHRHQC